MKRSSHHEEEKMGTPNNQNLVMKGDVKTTKQVKVNWSLPNQLIPSLPTGLFQVN